MGQLGLAITDKQITPAPLSFPGSGAVKSVSCGQYHSLFLMEDGSVYSSGDNECEQLGREGNSTPPGKISSLHTLLLYIVKSLLSSVFLYSYYCFLVSALPEIDNNRISTCICRNPTSANKEKICRCVQGSSDYSRIRIRQIVTNGIIGRMCQLHCHLQ